VCIVFLLTHIVVARITAPFLTFCCSMLPSYTHCLQVSTEIITPNLYHGNDRAFLLQNTLFRCGGAAMILSNRWTDAFKARFKLLHVVRTQVRVRCCGVCWWWYLVM
jgi:hypothetical protein